MERSASGLNQNNDSDSVAQLCVYKHCKWCGDIIPVRNEKQYRYKQTIKEVTYWFCGWNCLSKARKANPPRISKTSGKEHYESMKGRWEIPIDKGE